MERRFLSTAAAPVTIEKRADGGKRIVGYGSVFYRAGDPGTEYELWDGLRERIMPGAFDRALAERQDVRGLFNHDPSSLLGRTKSGTMRLSVDATGLRYEIDIPDTQIGRDVAVSIERGDLTGSSFAFVPTAIAWQETETLDIREINSVDLFDAGPVTYPAYEATTTALRSLDHLRAEYSAWKETRKSAKELADKTRRINEADAVAVRMRMLEIENCA